MYVYKMETVKYTQKNGEWRLYVCKMETVCILKLYILVAFIRFCFKKFDLKILDYIDSDLLLLNRTKIVLILHLAVQNAYTTQSWRTLRIDSSIIFKLYYPIFLIRIRIKLLGLVPKSYGLSLIILIRHRIS